jgi:PAS domain S-box-containing protein
LEAAQARDALPTPESRLRRMLEQTTLLAAITDDQDTLIYCNSALAALIDREPADIEGRRWSEVFGKSDADVEFIQDLRGGRMRPTYEGVIYAGSEQRVVAWTNTLLEERPDRTIVASLGEDVTARRAAERELRAVELERLHLQEAILAAESAERARLAEALHDDTIQVITAALLNLDRITPDNLDTTREQARASLASALERARHLLFALRPAELDHGGLRAAIQTLCAQTAADAGWTLAVEITDRRYPRPIEELVYRAMREAVLNARRHSNARALEVRAEERDCVLYCLVADDGVGFDLDSVRARPGAPLHLGLAALAERVRLARGTAQITTEIGAGTSVRFSLPVGPDSPLAQLYDESGGDAVGH